MRSAMQKLNQRVHDLVRFMRQELHKEGLITDEEYTELAMDRAECIKRLDDYDGVIQKCKELAASKRPSGLVSVLIQEIRDLNERLVDWKHEFLMYRNAWLREIGGKLIWKRHDIDAFVLTTRWALTNIHRIPSPAEEKAAVEEVSKYLVDHGHPVSGAVCKQVVEIVRDALVKTGPEIPA